MAKNLGTLFLDGESFNDVNGNHTPINQNNVILDNTNKLYDNSSYLFNGSNFIEVPDHADLQFGTGEFTIDFWIRRTTPNALQYVASKIVDTNADANGWYIGYNGAAHSIYFNGGSNEDQLVLDISDPLADGQWHHVAIMRQGTVICLCVDGVTLKATGGSTVNYTNEGVPIKIGTLGTYTGDRFTGNIENFRMVNQALWDWGTDFELTVEGLHYALPNYNPARPDTIRDLYNKKKVNLRGKAQTHEDRPTIKEFFTSSDFTSPEVPILPTSSGSELVASMNQGNSIIITHPGNKRSIAIVGVQESTTVVVPPYFDSKSNQGTVSISNWDYYNSGESNRDSAISIGKASGKLYFEAKMLGPGKYINGSWGAYCFWIGWANSDMVVTYNPGEGPNASNSTSYYCDYGHLTDVRNFAVDTVNKQVWSGYNGTWLGGGDPGLGTVPNYASRLRGSADNLNEEVHIAVCGYEPTDDIRIYATSAEGTYDPPTGFTYFGDGSPGEYVDAQVGDYLIESISYTQTKITKLSSGIEEDVKIKYNIN